jgi:polysaccharide biosynthesis/export protein
MDLRKHLALYTLTLLALAAGTALAQPTIPTAPATSDAPAAAPAEQGESVQIMPGDQVKMEVFRNPDMTSTAYVESNGTMRVPLVGAVLVAGMSQVEAAKRVEAALVEKEILKTPHVTLTVTGSQSRVSVLGEVRNQNRYAIESKTTIVDVLAMAGDRTDKAGDEAIVLRRNGSGKMERIQIDLTGIHDPGERVSGDALTTLRNGDIVYVPPASQYFVLGEVHKPEGYRMKKGLTVEQAIALAGGVTDKGTTGRVEVMRRTPSGDYVPRAAHLNDVVQAEDIITVKQRIL